MRRKQWIRVETLLRKIDLVLEHRLVGDWNELGEKLGASPKTIRWWIQGSAGHEPGEMPQKAFAALSALYAEALPDALRDAVDGLVVGAVSELEEALAERTSPADVFSFLHGAIAGEARLVTFRDEPELVEVNRRRDATQLPAVLLSAPFRIEFKPMHRLRAAIVLQNAGLRWGSVEAAFDRGRTVVFVPGLDEDGLPLTMSEHEQTGIHIFYCIQSGRPLPAALKAELQEPIELDRRVLGMLSCTYAQLAVTDRRCQVLALEIKGPGSSV